MFIMHKKLLLQEIYKLEICPLTLFESSMAQIYDLDPDPEQMSSEDLFTFWYEIEYKYNMMKTKGFSGDRRRLANMIKILENVGRRINSVLSDSFVDVFEDWLETHAILSPKTWARKRVEELYEVDPDNIYEGVLSEFLRYKDNSEYSTIEEGIRANIDKMPRLKKALLQFSNDDRQIMYDDLADEGYEEFGDKFGEEFNSTEEAEKFIEEYEFDPLETLDNFGVDELFLNIIKFPDVFEELYEYIVFPAWYGYWKPQGIDKIRENIEKITDQLNNVKSLPYEKQNALINAATNTAHQNGSMMEYYEQHYSVGESFLKNLSNRDTEDWDEELREVGVQI